MRLSQFAWTSFVLWTVMSSIGNGRDLFVHPEGRDDAPGTEAAPLATVQAAVNAATAGDVIHLGPPGAVFRQSVTFRGKSDITLDGHGTTLDGSDPLPADGWETVASGLRRLRLPRTTYDRHLLSFDGRTEHMGRTQSANSKPFPTPEQLTDGQFAFVPFDEASTDDKEGWLYVCGEAKQLEWSVRMNGVGFSGENRNIVVRNLAARRFLNDGFNIHGHAYDIVFENVDGYDCFDEGLSAHEDATCRIIDSRFWGCENAVADVNDCQTDYLRCEFSNSLGVDVLLIGRRHSLVDCRIINTPGSTALSAGSRGQSEKDFTLVLERVAITSSAADQKPRVRISDGTVTVRECDFTDVAWNASGADVRVEKSSLP